MSVIQWKPYLNSMSMIIESCKRQGISVEEGLTRVGRELRGEGQSPRGVDIVLFNLESAHIRLRGPYYRLYPAMMVALRQTRIDIPWSLLNLPFPTFELQWPVGSSVSVGGYDVSNLLLGGGTQTKSEIVSFAHKDEAMSKGVAACSKLDSLIILPGGNDAEMEATGGRDVCSLRREGDETIGESISRVYAGEDREGVGACFAVAIGVALLATGGHKHVAPDVLSQDLRDYLAARSCNDEPTMDRLATKAYRKRKAKGFTVGRDYFLPVPYPEQHGESSDPADRHLTHSHIRCGHWHVVRHGIRRLLSKAVWYEPTLVRPDLAPSQRKRAYAGELT